MSVYINLPHTFTYTSKHTVKAKTPWVQTLTQRSRSKHRAKQSYLSAPFPFWLAPPLPLTLPSRGGGRKSTAHHHTLLGKYDIKAYVLQHTDPCTNIARCNTVWRERGEGRARERGEPSDPFPARDVERHLHNPAKIIPPKNRDLV